MQKKYTQNLLITTALIVATITGFNGLSDPYLLFNSPSISGFNAIKTEPFYKQLVFKPYQISYKDINTLILGTSRAGIALDPDKIPTALQPAYNASIGGATSYINYRLLQQSLSKQHKPQQVILETAFFSFNQQQPMNTPNRDPSFENRIKQKINNTPNSLFFIQHTLDRLITLLSWESVRASIRMVTKQQAVSQGKRGSFIQLDNGQWRQQPPPKQPTRKRFQRSLKKYLHKEWFPVANRPFSLMASDNTVDKLSVQSSALDFYRISLRLLYTHDINTQLIILPMHGSLLSALQQTGLENTFQKWKQQLVFINNEEAALANRHPFPLWDYGHINSLSNEALPNNNENEHLLWFNDSAHASPYYGDLILQEILSPSSIKKNLVGTKLEPHSLQATLAQQREKLQIYQQQHPSVVQTIHSYLQKTGSQ